MSAALPDPPENTHPAPEPLLTPSPRNTAAIPQGMETGCPDLEDVLGTNALSRGASAVRTVGLPARGAPPVPPPQLPGLEVLQELGRGGMGVVFLARQRELDRLVAIKTLLAGNLARETERERFRREARAIARLRHPNIVLLHDFGEHEGHLYFVMEFCPGGSLEARLAGRPIAPREAATLVEQIARGIEHAHQQQIIHRDLKPANILLGGGRGGGGTSPSPPLPHTPPSPPPPPPPPPPTLPPLALLTPKITDFGLARFLDDSGRTRSNAVLGTPGYMAPEQARGRTREAGVSADIHALGAILYACLTGRPPFQAVDVADVLWQVMYEEPVPPSRLVPKIPADLETICLKCLQKDPAQRYAHAGDLAEELSRFLEDKPIRARSAGRLERARKWAQHQPRLASILALGALLGVLLLGGLVAQLGMLWGEHASLLAQLEQFRQAEQTLGEGAALKRERDELASLLVDNLLRPIGHHDSLRDPVEQEALLELAQKASPRVQQLFLERGLHNPETARRLARRVDSVARAVTGLNRSRKDEALAQSRWLLRERYRPLASRYAATLLTATLGDSDPATVRAAVQLLLEITARPTPEASGGPSPVAVLTDLADRLTPTDAGTAAAELVRLLRSWDSLQSLRQRVRMLRAVLPRAPRDEARRIAGQAIELLQAREQGASSLVQIVLVSHQLELIPWAEPELKAHLDSRAYPLLRDRPAALPLPLRELASTWFVQGGGEGLSRATLAVVEDGFSPVMGQGQCHTLAWLLERGQATEWADHLASQMKEAAPALTLPGKARILAILAARLEPPRGRQLASDLGGALLERLEKTRNPLEAGSVVEALVSLLELLEPVEASRFMARVVEQVPGLSSVDWSYWNVLKSQERIRLLDASRLSRLGERLVVLIQQTRALGVLVRCLNPVSELLEVLPAPEAQRLSRVLLRQMMEEADLSDGGTIRALFLRDLRRLVRRLEPQEAQQYLKQLQERLNQSSHVVEISHRVILLRAFLEGMERGPASSVARQAWTQLEGRLDRGALPASQTLAQAASLGALSGWLEPRSARSRRIALSHRILVLWHSTENRGDRAQYIDALEILARAMTADEKREIVRSPLCVSALEDCFRPLMTGTERERGGPPLLPPPPSEERGEGHKTLPTIQCRECGSYQLTGRRVVSRSEMLFL